MERDDLKKFSFFSLNQTNEKTYCFGLVNTLKSKLYTDQLKEWVIRKIDEATKIIMLYDGTYYAIIMLPFGWQIIGGVTSFTDYTWTVEYMLFVINRNKDYYNWQNIEFTALQDCYDFFDLKYKDIRGMDMWSDDYVTGSRAYGDFSASPSQILFKANETFDQWFNRLRARIERAFKLENQGMGIDEKLGYQKMDWAYTEDLYQSYVDGLAIFMTTGYKHQQIWTRMVYNENSYMQGRSKRRYVVSSESYFDDPRAQYSMDNIIDLIPGMTTHEFFELGLNLYPRYYAFDNQGRILNHEFPTYRKVQYDTHEANKIAPWFLITLKESEYNVLVDRLKKSGEWDFKTRFVDAPPGWTPPDDDDHPDFVPHMDYDDDFRPSDKPWWQFSGGVLSS